MNYLILLQSSMVLIFAKYSTFESASYYPFLWSTFSECKTTDNIPFHHYRFRIRNPYEVTDSDNKPKNYSFKTVYHLQKCEECKNFTAWGTCKGECGWSGMQERRSICSDGSSLLESFWERKIEYRKCYLSNKPCLAWGGWSSWSIFCDEITGRKRTRKCYSYSLEENENSTNTNQSRVIYDVGDRSIDLMTGKTMQLINETACMERYNSSKDLFSYTQCYGYKTWSEWSSSCSKTCGGGRKKRSQECLYTDQSKCVLPYEEEKDCNQQPCPRNGYWLQWSTFSECNSSCGNGTKTRRRFYVSPLYGGNHSSEWHGNLSQLDVEDCTRNVSCPSNISCIANEEATLGKWSMWGECSMSCGYGKKQRSRSKVTEDDKEAHRDVTSCYLADCPVDGSWGKWSSYSSCSKLCGSGIHLRERKCDDPPPINGGRICYGVAKETTNCHVSYMCPVDGGWSEWSNASKCDKPCGGGQMTKRRYCINPQPLFGGNPCSGPSTSTASCNTHSCQAVHLNVKVNFVDEKFYRWYPNLDSVPSKVLQNKITEQIFKLYQDNNKNAKIEKIIFHSFENADTQKVDARDNI